MTLIKDGLSEELQRLFLLWEMEYGENLEHDTQDTKAWNELVLYLMELEKKTKTL